MVTAALLLLLALLAAPLAAAAQQPAKVSRMGWLSIASSTPEVSHLIEAFSHGLRELGYVDGRNVTIDYRFADGRPERLPALAAELVALKVDVIVAPNPAGIEAAKHATTTIPIIMVSVSDPVRSGLVASLARPGGNITGLSYTASSEMFGKRLELLREVVPKISRVAFLRNPTNPDAAEVSRDVERAARALGVELRVLDARVPNELDSAFAAMTRDRAGALLLLGTRCSLFTAHGSRPLRPRTDYRRSAERGRWRTLASS